MNTVKSRLISLNLQFFLCLLSFSLLACSASAPTSEVKPKATASSSTSVTKSNQLIGVDGIKSWDALAETEKSKIRSFNTFYLHQSVGADLEDAANVIGYKFEYIESGSNQLSAGLNGGLFKASNGDTAAKINEFREMALLNSNTAQLAVMSFGYADIVEDKLTIAKTDYLAAANAIKANGMKILHITPPLVFNLPSDNHPKMQLRQWMLETFKNDVIFDLQSLESLEPKTGLRCEREGSWEICDSVRSTAACPSLNQGVDAPSGQGHLCHSQTQTLVKAFLYSIYQAGK